MRKVFCDICGADLTGVKFDQIYRILIDRDSAPFDFTADFPEVCEDCARSIHELLTQTILEKEGNRYDFRRENPC